MTIRKLCVQELDNAIVLSEEIKVSVKKGNYRIAINQIADLLFVMGQSLTCINRLESNQSARQVTLAQVSKTSLKNRPGPLKNKPGKVNAVNVSTGKKAECLRLLNAAIINFQTAKRRVRAGRYEDAENIIAATLTGRILRCVNRLR